MPSTSSDAPPSTGASDAQTSPHLDEPALPYAGFSWLEAGIIVGACVLITTILLITALTQPPCCAPSTQAEMLRGTSSRLSYFFLWALSTVPIFWACVRLRPGRAGWAAVGAGHTALAVIIPFSVQWAHNAIRSGLFSVWPPSDGDVPTFALHPGGVFTEFDFLGELIPYFILLMIGFIREGYLRAQARREQAEQLEREAAQLRSQLTEARLESLRMQINPHFFHNTLHTISTMAGRDPDGIRTATARLSDLMRHVLSTSDQQEVSLEQEVDVLKSYLDIQNLRLDDRLDVTFEIDPDTRQALVPTLVLQPLAENAVKHGFEGADQTGHLVIRASRSGDVLRLEVADDGPGLPDKDGAPADEAPAIDPTEVEGSIGLQNIKERLKGLYGPAGTLDFEPVDGGGLRVVIHLPYHRADASEDLRTSGVVAP